ncbi:MAG: hypothetical protein A3I13_03245 [Gammaproteobacteria bacterium RIFCSPLOWO2_02_FULL_47_50]|jgi:hypothetical protein|nr:MAG: hypothetical protein A2993_04085 [Gammaproteobacteria bacterium RIFCSPLOWO2_01_FULL_47_190]OGT65321.1 MAG: hypothetical protein A2993_04095 [Gammaproteobacteria bacterium RIFCSPLOWO2_01_FULL_47_190]OGT74595.1 MAG: hypothetical protein A2W76_10015 [Gammaproteobacteria bacterium RIFCSPLOWO2_12_47_11]OGT78607.1 MAG: hypothetical protein A3I13_03245 [Gammaproteobacteria bacterium RIFCSPLOWO2_02_FULL_47_50]OGT83632.1 MAG: hypothetical protein A3G42_05925 [Gammaproteobacteria bacterium RIFCSP
MLQTLSYTLTAIILYLISDWLLQRMEVAAGHRFQYRSLVFFCILAFLALLSFTAIRIFINNQ